MVEIERKIINKIISFNSNLHQITNNEFNDLNLGEGQNIVLTKIHEFPGTNCIELSKILHRDKTTVSKIIKKLISKDLIYLQEDNNDKRIHKIYIKPEQEELIKEIQRKFRKIGSATFKNITNSEKEELNKILEKLNLNSKK